MRRHPCTPGLFRTYAFCTWRYYLGNSYRNDGRIRWLPESFAIGRRSPPSIFYLHQITPLEAYSTLAPSHTNTRSGELVHSWTPLRRLYMDRCKRHVRIAKRPWHRDPNVRLHSLLPMHSSSSFSHLQPFVYQALSTSSRQQALFPRSSFSSPRGAFDPPCGVDAYLVLWSLSTAAICELTWLNLMHRLAGILTSQQLYSEAI